MILKGYTCRMPRRQILKTRERVQRFGAALLTVARSVIAQSAAAANELLSTAPNAIDFAGPRAVARRPQSGILHIRVCARPDVREIMSRRIAMEDRWFFIAVMALVLALAAGEIVYGVYGPFSASAHRIDEFSSSNRTR
jgi:hypothetical protein